MGSSELIQLSRMALVCRKCGSYNASLQDGSCLNCIRNPTFPPTQRVATRASLSDPTDPKQTLHSTSGSGSDLSPILQSQSSVLRSSTFDQSVTGSSHKRSVSFGSGALGAADQDPKIIDLEVKKVRPFFFLVLLITRPLQMFFS